MNFTNSLRKLLDLSNVEDKVTNQAKDVYEELMLKNFEIVTTFLQRVNQIYEKHNEFQKNFTTINDKIQQLSSITDNIHYEFRTTHLAIDKKLNEVAIDYLNLKTELKTSRMIPSDKQLSQKKIPSVILSINPLRQKHSTHQVSSESKTIGSEYSKKRINENNQVCSAVLETSMIVGDKSIAAHNLCDNYSENQSQTHKNSKKKVFFVENKHQTSSESMSCSQKFQKFQIFEDDQLQTLIGQNFINQIQKQNQNVISKRLQEICNEVLEKISNLSKENETFKSQINLQISELPKAEFITEASDRSILAIKQIDVINSQICNIKILLGDLEERRIDKKTSKQYFEESLENLSKALTEELSLAHRKFSNKIATQNAIQFLEKKINRVIQDASTSKIHLNQQQKSSILYQAQANNKQPYLKVSGCVPKQKNKYTKPQTAVSRNKNFSKKSLDYQQQVMSFTDLKILDNCDLNQKSKEVTKQTTAAASHTMTPQHSSSFCKKQIKNGDLNGQGCKRLNYYGQVSMEYLNPIPHRKTAHQSKINQQNKQNVISEKIWKERAISVLSGVKKKRRKQQLK